MEDDVPDEVKRSRLQELIHTFHSIAAVRNRQFIGTEQLVLIEKVSTVHNIYCVHKIAHRLICPCFVQLYAVYLNLWQRTCLV